MVGAWTPIMLGSTWLAAGSRLGPKHSGHGKTCFDHTVKVRQPTFTSICVSDCFHYTPHPIHHHSPRRTTVLRFSCNCFWYRARHWRRVSWGFEVSCGGGASWHLQWVA